MHTSSLASFVASLSYGRMRQAESLHAARLPDGKRLRGVSLTPWLYLSRDRRFYAVDTAQRAQPLAERDVLTHVTVAQVQVMYFLAERAARRRRASAPTHA